MSKSRPGFEMPSIFSPYPASFFPTLDAARHGAEQARYGKEPFKLTAYQVKVFDMAKEAERTEYCKLMERLMPLCQNAQCVVSKNELQVLSTPNGQGWFRYVEWFEYKLNESSLTTGREKENETPEPEDEDDSNDSEGFSTDGFL